MTVTPLQATSSTNFELPGITNN